MGKEMWQNPDGDAVENKVAAGVGGSGVSTDIERINVGDIVGPLIIFYGPSEVGKTVALLRLCAHVSSGYSIEVDTTFRSDVSYASSVAAFEQQRREDLLAPPATGAINFLLVNVSLRGSSFCQILEAPGEHFFPQGSGSEVQYPHYLQKIFQAPARKIFAIFFERQLMTSGRSFNAYANSVLSVLRQHADTARDRVIIVFNKCDERSELYRDGKPVIEEFRKALYSHPGFAPLGEFLKVSRFRRIHFVPFSSGRFGVDGQGKKTFAKSAKHYPESLWHAIHDCVEGAGLLQRLRQVLSR